MGSSRKQPGKSAPKPRRNDLQNPTNTQSLFKKEKKKTKKQLKQQRQGAADVRVDDAIVTGRNAVDGGEPVGLSLKLGFFLEAYQTANNIQLSSLELESFTDKCMVDLSEGVDVDVNTLGNQVKAAFAMSWKEMLCDNSLLDGEINPGSPMVLVIAASAIRVLEFLRGFKSFTRECRVAKLFSRHIKVEEQATIAAELFLFARQSDPRLSAMVALLKNRVNIAGGTPSRIKKLIDMEALGLSRLSLVLLDIRPDVKNYSLLSLPQVKDEFWDLYKIYFHDRVVEGNLRICLYGPLRSKSKVKSESRNE